VALVDASSPGTNMAAVVEGGGVINGRAPPSWMPSLRRFGRRPSLDAERKQDEKK